MAQDPGVNFLPLGWEAPAPAEATIRLDSTPGPRRLGSPWKQLFLALSAPKRSSGGRKGWDLAVEQLGGEERDCFLRMLAFQAGSEQHRAGPSAALPEPWGGGQCCRGGKGPKDLV